MTATWILALGALLALGTLNSELGNLWHGDNARYILLAQSLATGQGYRSIYEPGSPLHTFNPPGFPLLLSPIVALWGARAFLAMHGMVAGWGILSLFLWHRWVREEAEPAVARASLLVLATTPLWVEWCGQILSEFPYIAFSLMALLWARRGGGLAATAFFLLAAVSIRSVGLVLILAAVGWMLERERRKGGWPAALRRAGRMALLLGAPLLGWVVWCRWAGSGPEGPYSYLFWRADPFQPDLGALTLSALLGRIIENGRSYAMILGQVLVWPTFHMTAWVSVLAGMLAAICVGAGLARRMVRQGSAAEGYCAASAALILVWPGTEPRFLLPILPWIWLYFLETCARFRWGRKVLIALLAGNLAGSLWTVGLNFAGVRRRPDLQGFAAAHDWMSRNTPPEAVIMSNRYTVTALLADRRSVGFPYTSKEEWILDTLRDFRVTHVLDDGSFIETKRYLAPVIRSHPELFEPELIRFGPANLLTVRRGRGV